MFKLVPLNGFFPGPLDISAIRHYPLQDSEQTFNQCCGSRIELSPYTWYKSIDFGRYLKYHTRGIRLIPGKINPEEVQILPEEKLIEVPMGGNVLTFIVLKKQNNNIVEVKTPVGAGFSDKKYTLTENKENVVVFFPYFSFMVAFPYGKMTIESLKRDYPNLNRDVLNRWLEYYNDQKKYYANLPGYQVFVVTDGQLNDWKDYVSKYKVNVILEEYGCVNNNYGPEPRLNLFITHKD